MKTQIHNISYGLIFEEFEEYYIHDKTDSIDSEAKSLLEVEKELKVSLSLST